MLVSKDEQTFKKQKTKRKQKNNNNNKKAIMTDVFWILGLVDFTFGHFLN